MQTPKRLHLLNAPIYLLLASLPVYSYIRHRQTVCTTCCSKCVLQTRCIFRCCSPWCAPCGGSACSSQPGGASSCCANAITSANEFCSGDKDAPCLLNPSGTHWCRSAKNAQSMMYELLVRNCLFDFTIRGTKFNTGKRAFACRLLEYRTATPPSLCRRREDQFHPSCTLDASVVRFVLLLRPIRSRRTYQQMMELTFPFDFFSRGSSLGSFVLPLTALNDRRR